MKTLKITIVSLIIFNLFPVYTFAANVRSSVPFTDIEGHVNEHHITYMYKLGLIDGYSDNTFRPDNNITRGEFTKFIYNVFQIPEIIDEYRFPDVEEGNKFYKYIYSLRTQNILNGFTDGTFRPADNITRAEAVKIIFNAARSKDSGVISTSNSCSFTDVRSTKFYEYICAFDNYTDDGLEPILDTSDSFFYPGNPATRADISRWVLNAGTYIPQKLSTPNERFVSLEGWDGTFTRPGHIQEFKNVVELERAISLKWEDLVKSRVDKTVDGYIIERKEKNSAIWEPIDQRGGINGKPQESVVTVGGTIEAGDVFIVRINGEEYSYTAVSGDDIENIVIELIDLVNVDDAISATLVNNKTDEFEIISRIAGEPYKLAVSSTDGGGNNTQTIVYEETEENEKGEDIREGVVLASNFGKYEEITISDLSVSSDTKYDYRLAAFKFIPKELAETEYETQDDLEEDIANRDNMIIGYWEYENAQTKE